MRDRLSQVVDLLISLVAAGFHAHGMATARTVARTLLGGSGHAA